MPMTTFSGLALQMDCISIQLSYLLLQQLLCCMGVPVFFKWMCMRNPKILLDAAESQPQAFESGNPYIDNFYVDMNGLIHPACNPKGENIKEPSNFEEQCNNIFQYIDKIINIVRPRKLLYLAIDGVAPRAKMNQQRSRRFRAAMEGQEMRKKKEQLLSQFKKNDIDQEKIEEIQSYVNKKSFDSNVITPGTPFLYDVAEAIRAYVKSRLAGHRLWRNLTVIFSDANCPGEGEHKIMEFIRQERASATYDPNQSHCIYGADADLIMLGLAAHQPRFYIIREIVITANDKWCSTCGKRGHYFLDCRAAESIQDQAKVQEKINAGNIQVQFQFINLKLVREYLHLTFKRATIPFGYDLQRIIDDFVFLCFFVGNDFLPHVPCLTIREGGIDMLLKVYEYCLSIMPDYLTKSGEVNFKSLKIYIHEMSLYQEDIIAEIINKESQAKNRDQMNRNNSNSKSQPQVFVDYSDPLTTFKQQLKKMTNSENNLENYSVFSHEVYNYKEKYYREKFHIKASQFLQLKHHISNTYLQALSWICRYYYKGVASWSWYYPFHYSPFFSDLDVAEPQEFSLGEPFKPYEQLMAVLPPKTANVLPPHLRTIMTNIDSPIADYFPTEFQIDLTGKKFAWLGEVLLPFIDDKRLLRAMGNYEEHLTDYQKKLNRYGAVNLYFSRTGQLGKKVVYNSGAGRNPIQAEFDRYNLQGTLTFQQRYGEIQEWKFVSPTGRYHDVKLKEGITFTLLQELNEDLIRRADRKAFGGERFVRIIERSLNQRAHQLFSAPRQEDSRRGSSNNNYYKDRGYQRDNRDNRDNRDRGEDRDRSRDNRNRRDQSDRYQRRPSNDDRRRNDNRRPQSDRRDNRN